MPRIGEKLKPAVSSRKLPRRRETPLERAVEELLTALDDCHPSNAEELRKAADEVRWQLTLRAVNEVVVPEGV